MTFLLVNLAWSLVMLGGCAAFYALWRLWRWLGTAGSATIQVATYEERKAEEAFVEHARRRAKEVYISLGEV